jgi:hypothetical protein
MKQLIRNGLLANVASLGIHWIYDHKLLEEVSQTQDLLFLSQQKALYEKASSSYYSYPNQKLGDVSFQGHILIWLYQSLQNNPNFTKEDYGNMICTHLEAGGDYDGYIESYAKTLLSYFLSKETNTPLELPAKNDDHLVGFMPYLSCKALHLSSEQAFELTNLFSEDPLYLDYFHMFDQLLTLLKTLPRKEAIEKALTKAPKSVLDILKKAIEIQDTNEFIEKYAGRACAITYSIPVIIHVLYHQDSFHDAIQKNAVIGGSVADRATLIGAIYGEIDTPQEKYIKKMGTLFDF